MISSAYVLNERFIGTFGLFFIIIVIEGLVQIGQGINSILRNHRFEFIIS